MVGAHHLLPKVRYWINKMSNENTRHLEYIHRFIHPLTDRMDVMQREQGTKGKQTHTLSTTLLLLHGTGRNEDLIPLAYELSQNAGILSPEERF